MAAENLIMLTQAIAFLSDTHDKAAALARSFHKAGWPEMALVVGELAGVTGTKLNELSDALGIQAGKPKRERPTRKGG